MKTPRRSVTAGRPRRLEAEGGASPLAHGASVRAAGKGALRPSEVEQFRRLLLASRREILGDVKSMQDRALGRNPQESSGNLSNNPTHLADVASDNYDLEMTLGLMEGRQSVLEEIDDALARIEEGSYGICLGTGRPIGRARLRARPWARYCIEYAEALEKGLA
jgi:RNA polymerase-binding protein DksA